MVGYVRSVLVRPADWPEGLGLGGIGLFIFVCILWVGIRRASRVAVESGNTADLFTATLLVFCALHGFLETTIVGPSFLTLLYMIAVVRLGFPAGAPSESGPPIENRR